MIPERAHWKMSSTVLLGIYFSSVPHRALQRQQKSEQLGETGGVGVFLLTVICTKLMVFPQLIMQEEMPILL